eukprot:TRINITY_DN5224_c0_g1_i1.p1 TRINITY_DN5224_c0_g1~~TRINITY_DN5224_c0_g1_i1.p1  ORF type:complete len:331 (+),score=75.40 TRINITY_DN5224_c0_g1_i1:83-994(+)
MYERGYYVKRDLSLSDKYFEKALPQLQLSAKLGDSEALCDIGYCFDKGYKVKRDKKKAFSFYESSAALNYPRGQSNLGYMYNTGEGVQEDINKALELFKTAADAGFPLAQSNLAEMFHEQKNPDCLHYFQLASNQGYPPALFSLGEIYLKGKGVSKDIRKGLSYLEESVKRNSVDGYSELTNIYLKGYEDHIKPDINKAFDYVWAWAKQDKTGKKKLRQFITSFSQFPRYISFQLASEWPQSCGMVSPDCVSNIKACCLLLIHRGIYKELIGPVLFWIIAIWPTRHTISMFRYWDNSPFNINL